ncbi:MAG TPA: pyrimidine reductase family protein [Actinocrinis sp.]|uniref:pyrimidine reductase family protein n=1 Tax=Actinocrinis sp. TaxID=1920516 RepID=UPI002DDD468E|nr:pyrimidine reductase family protein [Actinocrinis sp.]HEV3169797.1 pyrimidine reductase family protein [Actinocrinis sp.]
MRQLIPRTSRDAEPDLAAVYAYPGHARRWMRANMVASVDGAAQADGKSGGLSGSADKRVMSVLRALADVIVVGASTVRVEGYDKPPSPPRPQFAALRAEAGQTEVASYAVVSASLDLDFDSPRYTEARIPTITITVADAPTDRLAAARAAGEVIIAGEGRVDMALALDTIAGSGRGRLLCEGGPHLLSAIAHASYLDELCLTLSPQLRGGEAFRLLEGVKLDPAVPVTLHTLLVEEGFLFARYLTAPEQQPQQ